MQRMYLFGLDILQFGFRLHTSKSTKWSYVDVLMLNTDSFCIAYLSSFCEWYALFCDKVHDVIRPDYRAFAYLVAFDH